MTACSFRFDTFEESGETFGRIAEDVTWQTGITGYRCSIARKIESTRNVMLWVQADLREDGTLIARNSTEYDFGSGPAINNLPVIYASLKHDIGCHLTHLGLIPWKFRAWFDKEYRQDLLDYGASVFRSWYQWTVVRSYSKFVAFHNRYTWGPYA